MSDNMNLKALQYFTQEFHSNKVIVLHRNVVAGLCHARSDDLSLPQIDQQDILALDLNP